MIGTPDVVVVGAAARDVDDHDPRGWRLGGGVSYAALTLARLGLRTGALVGADADAARSAELDFLRAAGVDVVVAPLAHGPMFVNTETPAGRIQHTPDVSDPVPPDAVPAPWRDAGAWLFGPVAAEIPEAWADVPAEGALVALGWQGLLRVLVRGERVRHLEPGASEVVARSDLIGVGRDDIGPSTTIEVMLDLLRPGATLLLTDGANGGIAMETGPDGGPRRERRWDIIPADRFVDAVGAGDSFLAGVFAARVDASLTGWRPGDDSDLVLGAAVGSLICEGPGLHGVPDRDATLRRMERAAHARPTG
jgi:sugar/nucleoside kinase (ribokinase family)